MSRVREIVAQLEIPVIAAPMFLVSNPAMALACCAEGIMGNPPKTPPPSQAMITNIDQLSPKAQAMIPKEAIMAGGTEMMMKAANPQSLKIFFTSIRGGSLTMSQSTH